MRVLSNVEIHEVSGAGWVADFIEWVGGLFAGSSATATEFKCENATMTNGNTSTMSQACNNGVTTTVTTGPGFVTTQTVTPGTNIDGSIGFKMVGGAVVYTAAPNVTISTVVNGTQTVSR